jgi:hypothetical protein
MRRRSALVAAVAALLLLAGCSEIPTAGPVRDGATQVPDEPAIVFLPNPPAAGAKPVDIVSGFLQAGAGSDFSVAKQYLTKEFATQWHPSAGVLVHDKPLKVVAQGTDAVHVDVPTVANVKPNGTYTPSISSQPLDFRLRQVGGQWRIAQAPDGIVLAETVFERTYKPRSVDFFDPSYRRLVPDVRWFAVRSNPARSVARALLAGPAGPLTGGIVVSAFPAGTKLESAATATDGSTAVAITVPGRDPSRQVTDRMQQQLLRSLQLQTAGLLRLFVNGRVAPLAPLLQVQGPVQAPVVYAGGRFGTVQSTGTVSEDSVLGKRVAALKPTAVTLSAHQRLAAVRTKKGQVAVVTPDSSRVVDSRTGLTAPTLDQSGWTYSVPVDDPSGLIAISVAPTRQVVHLDTTDLGGTKVIAIEASPDGTRLLVLVQRAGGDQTAYAAGILRDPKGAPIGLTTDLYPVGVPSGTAVDATWADDATVAILSRATDGTDTVTTQQLGGLATPAGRLSNAESIVGTSSKSDLRARDNTGNVLEPSASVTVWQSVFPTTVNVSVLAVQR